MTPPGRSFSQLLPLIFVAITTAVSTPLLAANTGESSPTAAKRTDTAHSHAVPEHSAVAAKPLHPAVTGGTACKHRSTARRIPIDELTEQLASTSIDIRIKALHDLAAWGPEAEPALPAIINVLNDNRACNFGSLSARISPVVTEQVLDTLKQIGKPARIASPYLVAMLNDRNELFHRDRILETLEVTGLDDSGTKTIMDVVLQEGKLTKSRALALRVLAAIDPPPMEARDMLRDIIEDRNDKLSRAEAIKVLARLEDRAKELADQTVGPDEAAKAARINDLREQLLDEDNPAGKLDLVRKIGTMGSSVSRLAPCLIQMLSQNPKDTRMRLELARSIGSMGPPAVAGLPILLSTLLNEKDQMDRGVLCRAITSIDPDGKRSIPLIVPALEDPFRARIAIELLDEIGTGQSTALAEKTRKRWAIRSFGR